MEQATIEKLRQIFHSVDAWLFDLDGTLVDSFEACHRAMNRYLSEYGTSIDRAWNRAHFSNTIEQVLLAVANTCGFEFHGSLEEEVEKLERLIVQHASLVRIYPGAIECLRWLRQRGWRIGLVTAGGHKEGWSNVQVLQRAYGDEAMYDVVVTNSDVQKPKPHPESIWRCCEAWGIEDGSRLVYVGDSGRDVRLMKQASVGGYAIFLETTKLYASIATNTPTPDLILRDVKHLYDLFREVERRDPEAVTVPQDRRMNRSQPLPDLPLRKSTCFNAPSRADRSFYRSV